MISVVRRISLFDELPQGFQANTTETRAMLYRMSCHRQARTNKGSLILHGMLRENQLHLSLTMFSVQIGESYGHLYSPKVIQAIRAWSCEGPWAFKSSPFFWCYRLTQGFGLIQLKPHVSVEWLSIYVDIPPQLSKPISGPQITYNSQRRLN